MQDHQETFRVSTAGNLAQTRDPDGFHSSVTSNGGKGGKMKRIFVSDVHMGAGKSFQPGYVGHVYDWLSEREASAFADFLNYLNDSDVDEIILLGDIMDNWVCPVDTPPPTFEDIIAAGINGKIIRNLRNLSDNKKTIYVPGNHDMALTETFLRATFPHIGFQNEYRQDDILAAHGSEHTMFCAADPINDVTDRLPIGYYISRVAATNATRTGSDNSLMSYLGTFIKNISEGTVLDVFDTAAREAGLNVNTAVEKTISDSITIEDVRTRYSNLYSQWNDDLIPRKSAAEAELNNLWPVVWNLRQRNRIIIFGHTHNKDLNKLRVDEMNEESEDMYIYANTGTWCEYDKGKDFTFVETEKNEDDAKHYVRVKTWDQNNMQPASMQEEFIQL